MKKNKNNVSKNVSNNNPILTNTNEHTFIDKVTVIFKYLILIPPIIYLLNILKLKYNIPFYDDYDAIIDFIFKFTNSTNIIEKINLLFSQHNEHRILSTRIISLIYFYITSNINFKFLSIVGCGQLMICLWIISKLLKKEYENDWIFPTLILSMTIFDFSNIENCTTAMASLANFSVFLFTFITINLYSKKSTLFTLLAIFFNILLIFSNGNGMIGAGAVILYLLLSKNFKSAITSIIITLIFVFLYFKGFPYTSSNPNKLDLDTISTYFFKMAGNNFNESIATFIVIISFISLLFTLQFSEKFKLIFRHNLLISFLSFVVVSMAITSIFRSSLGIEQALSSRYHIYSSLFIGIAVCLMYFYIKDSSKRRYFSIIALILIGWNFINNVNLGKEFFAQQNQMIHSRAFVYPMSAMDHAKSIADSACTLGIYCINDFKP